MHIEWLSEEVYSTALHEVNSQRHARFAAHCHYRRLFAPAPKVIEIRGGALRRCGNVEEDNSWSGIRPAGNQIAYALE